MAKTDYKNIDQYHKAFPADIAARMQKIRDAVHKVVPGVEEVISYQIPCFKYEGYLIYYAGFPNHVSLSNPFSKALLEHFKDDFKKYKVSKSVIQFPNSEDLPLSLITKIIQFRKKENEANSKKKK